ncbi:PF06067 domain protein [Leptospira interrogans serovar Pomona str. UT364]|nr:PF06067 domain protein [Leptospira interrogans serovar Pomona str. UT364]
MIFQDEGKLNVVIYNSHNRSNSLEIFYGFLRFACSNQLLIRNLGNGNQKSFRHHKANLEVIKDWVVEILFGFNDLADDIRFLKVKVLNPSQVKEFANTALDYRFQSDLQEYRRYLVESILRVRRNEDNGNTAWKVLNRVQETITKGLASYPDKNKYMRYIKCRPIQGLDRLISFNTDLWQLAKEI